MVKSKAYSKTKGNAYEVQIAKELREIGYPNVVTSRSESKSTDDNKIDLVDKDNKLPVAIQLKKTKATPQYFKIRLESSVNPKNFVVIWNKQEKRKVNICSVGEVVMMDKQLFYEMLQAYQKEIDK